MKRSEKIESNPVFKDCLSVMVLEKPINVLTVDGDRLIGVTAIGTTALRTSTFLIGENRGHICKNGGFTILGETEDESISPVFGKIHLGIRPSYDLSGKLVSHLHFNNDLQEIAVTIERDLKVQSIKISYFEAQNLGLLNLKVLEPFFSKL